MALWEIKSSPATEHAFELLTALDILDEFDGPLTFTFRDQRENLLIANLCAVGTDLSRYLVSKTDELVISDLKNGMISFRSAMIQPPLWLVDVRSDGQVANVWDTTVDELPSDVIPEPNVLLTEQLEAQQLADEKLAKFAKSHSDGNVTFDGTPVVNHEIEATFYGKFCQLSAEILTEICTAMRVTPPIFRLGMTAESSYAVDLKVAQRDDDAFNMFPADQNADPKKTRRAFDYLMSMLADDQPSPEALLLIKLFRPLRQHYGNMLELVSTSGAEIAVRTRTNPGLRKLSRKKLQENLRSVRDLGYPFNYLTVRGELVEGQVKKVKKLDTHYRILVNDVIYEGVTSDLAAEQMQEIQPLGKEVLAKLEMEESGNKPVTYKLIEIGLSTDGSPHSVT